MTMPTHAQTAAGLDATITAMEQHPELDADAAARLAIHGDPGWTLPFDDTTDSLLYEAVVDEIAYQHAPHLDADERDTAREIGRDTALRCARDGAARFHAAR